MLLLPLAAKPASPPFQGFRGFGVITVTTNITLGTVTISFTGFTTNSDGTATFTGSVTAPSFTASGSGAGSYSFYDTAQTEYSQLIGSPDIHTNNVHRLPTNAIAGVMVATKVGNSLSNQWRFIPLAAGQYLGTDGNDYYPSNMPPGGSGSTQMVTFAAGSGMITNNLNLGGAVNVGTVVSTNGIYSAGTGDFSILGTNAAGAQMVSLTAANGGKLALRLASVPTNDAPFTRLSSPLASGQFWTNITGARCLLAINYTTTASAVSGAPSLCMTNITSGETFNATNSLALGVILSGRAVFLVGTNEYFVITNQSSGNASAEVVSTVATRH